MAHSGRFRGPRERTAEGREVAQELLSTHHVLELRNVRACQQPVRLVLEIRLLSPIVIVLNVQRRAYAKRSRIAWRLRTTSAPDAFSM